MTTDPWSPFLYTWWTILGTNYASSAVKDKYVPQRFTMINGWLQTTYSPLVWLAWTCIGIDGTFIGTFRFWPLLVCQLIFLKPWWCYITFIWLSWLLFYSLVMILYGASQRTEREVIHDEINFASGRGLSCSVHVGHASKDWININSRLVQLGSSLFAVKDACLSFLASGWCIT